MATFVSVLRHARRRQPMGPTALRIVGATSAMALGLLMTAVPAASAAGGRGSLLLKVDGLPTGVKPDVRLSGPGLRTRVRTSVYNVRRAKPGRYVALLKTVTAGRTRGIVRKGARATPTSRRVSVTVRSGRGSRMATSYGTVVNPGVRGLPRGAFSVQGPPQSPTALTYRRIRGAPARGNVLTAPPSRALPAGLLAKVTGVSKRRGLTTLSLRPAAISEAVPAFDFQGHLTMRPSTPAATTSHRARSSAKRSCEGPKDFDVGAKLDELELRRASSSLSPAQVSFTFAVRTTEWAGPKNVLAGVSCSWEFGRLGPWQGAIPTPIPFVVIPVYASVPLTASADADGSLAPFKINVASTSVINFDLGSHNAFSAGQQGSNVWLQGSPGLTGKGSLAASLKLEFGAGNPKVADIHGSVGFGPKFSWRSGEGCRADLDIGSMSVGARIGKLKPSSPSFSAFSIPLWQGCGGRQPSGGGSSTPAPGAPASSGAPTPQTLPSPSLTRLATPTTPCSYAERPVFAGDPNIIYYRQCAQGATRFERASGRSNALPPIYTRSDYPAPEEMQPGSVSASGRYALVRAEHTLSSTPYKTRDEVWRWDQQTGSWTRVDVPAAGGSECDRNYGGIGDRGTSISSDGHLAAFSTCAPLTSDDSGTTQDVYTRDLTTNTTQRISPPGCTMSFPAVRISDDARYLAFDLCEQSAPSGCSGPAVFMRDRVAGNTFRPSSVCGSTLDMSTDGRFTLIAGGNMSESLSIYDRDTGLTSPLAGSNDARIVQVGAISDDGQRVMYVEPDDSGGALWLLDRARNTRQRLDVAWNGTPDSCGYDPNRADLSRDGTEVVFDSCASLTPEASSGGKQLYLARVPR